MMIMNHEDDGNDIHLTPVKAELPKAKLEPLTIKKLLK